MDTRKIASEYRMAHWGERLQERAQSGQSIEEFCTVSGISRNAYFYWQRKLRVAACVKLAEESNPNNRALVPSGWMQLSPQVGVQHGSAVTIEISSCVVHATAKTDMKLLKVSARC